MIFFRVFLNEKQIASVGGAELDVLTFGLLRAAATCNPVLQLGGMSKSSAKHYQWIYRRLIIGDNVRLVVADRADGHQYPEASGALGSDEESDTGRPTSLAVTLPKGDRLIGAANSEQNLQITATWSRVS